MRRLAIVSFVLALTATPSLAHFQEIIPSADVLPEGGEVSFDLVFTHPMERGPVMEMARPARVGMVRDGRTVDLSGALTAIDVGGRTAWRLATRLAGPGAGVFFVEPKPYWEAAEKKWIVHYAKVVVDAFASGEGWAASVGLPVEIEPLVRPTGLWTGNLFRGVVRRDGEPAPFAEIEVEWVNDGSVTPPNDAFVTQVIKADERGAFAYAMPRAGWWGFAALVDGPEAPGPDGKPAPTERGGLIWVRTTDMGGAPAPKR